VGDGIPLLGQRGAEPPQAPLNDYKKKYRRTELRDYTTPPQDITRPRGPIVCGKSIRLRPHLRKKDTQALFPLSSNR